MEAEFGNTVDILMFRFYFWQEIEFLDRLAKFPREKMRKGRFLGISWNVGDAFTYWVLPNKEDSDDPWPRVIARSVVRPEKSTPEDSENVPVTKLPKLFQGDSELEPVLLDWDEAEDILGNVTATGDHVVAMEVETPHEKENSTAHLGESS